MIERKIEHLPQAEIGILGGTGLYEIEGIHVVDELELMTPFGKPSDPFVVGTLEGKNIAFLSRHGRGHLYIPSEINYRANVYGFKMLGVKRIISVSSVGSLREKIRPKDIVFCSQFYDRTRRENTFFGEGIAAHISFAQPICPELSGILHHAGKELGMDVHKGGTYICIEGPAFSSVAESHIYRSWGCDVIGMTGATEAKLCREAEICYASMNLVTDYDVWHEEEETVSVELILENVKHNIQSAKKIIKKAVVDIPAERGAACDCAQAAETCIVTQSELVPQEIREKLKHIIGKNKK